MKKKKSRIEIAREIIARLREGLNKQQPTEPKRNPHAALSAARSAARSAEA